MKPHARSTPLPRFPLLVELVGEALRLGHSRRARSWVQIAQRVARERATGDEGDRVEAELVAEAFRRAEELVHELGAAGRATLAAQRR